VAVKHYGLLFLLFGGMPTQAKGGGIDDISEQGNRVKVPVIPTACEAS
jgi:hypothetical protein